MALPGEFQTPSFIPKKTLVVPSTRRSSLSLPLVSGLVIFVGSLLVYGGAYLYKEGLMRIVADKEVSLEKGKSAFEEGTIRAYSRTDARLLASKELLSKHISLESLYGLIDEHTLGTVRFRSFSFSHGQDRYELKMTGEAQNYASIALQSDAFSATGLLRDIVFSDLNLDPLRKVTFAFAATIDPKLLSYEGRILSLRSDSQTPQEPTAAPLDVAVPEGGSPTPQ